MITMARSLFSLNHFGGSPHLSSKPIRLHCPLRVTEILGPFDEIGYERRRVFGPEIKHEPDAASDVGDHRPYGFVLPSGHSRHQRCLEGVSCVLSEH